MAGPYRGGRRRPTFDTHVTMRRVTRSLDDQRGTSFSVKTALALKASLTKPNAPTGAPPASASATPLDQDGWKGWWSGGSVAYPPPEDGQPVSATGDAPMVWRSEGKLGADGWGEPEPHEMLLRADMRQRSGTEADAGGVQVAATVAGFRVQAANLRHLREDLGDIPKLWTLHVGPVAWNITEVLKSWEPNRYVDLRAVRAS